MSTFPFPFARHDAEEADVELLAAVRRCARRDLPSLHRLYELTASRLHAQLLQMLDDPEDAALALSECYVRIWQAAATYLPQHCPPGDWLRGIARQVAIERLRGEDGQDNAARQLALLRMLVEGDEPGAGDADATGWQCLRLAYLSGATPAQLADAFAVPVATVRQWLRQELASLAGPDALTREALLGARHVLGVQGTRVRRRYAARLQRDPLARRTRLEWEARLAVLAIDPPPVRAPRKVWPGIAAQLEERPWRSAGNPARRWLWITALLVAAAVAWLWMRPG